MKQIFVCLSLTSVSSTLELYERSWDAELLAQAAKDGWQNTMRNIINRVFGHPIHLNFITVGMCTVNQTDNSSMRNCITQGTLGWRLTW
jgi:hypothetical protein